MKKVLIVLVVFVLSLATIGTASVLNEKAKEKKTTEIKKAMESYEDYVNYRNYVEQYIKTEKEKGRERFDYEGEFKEIWDRMGELYEIALKDSKSGPYLEPPPVFAVCWWMYCTRAGCSGTYNKTCKYSQPCCASSWPCPKCYHYTMAYTNDGIQCPINGSGCVGH